jgi:hypothetical protein
MAQRPEGRAYGLCRLFEARQAFTENASDGAELDGGHRWCNCVRRREAQRKRRRRSA